MTTQKKIDNKFNSSDAWIFLSIAHGQGKGKVCASLEDLIVTADCINHAIPTDQEIVGAVNRLIAADLITIQNGCFKLTKSSENLFKKAQKKSGSFLRQWQLLEVFMQGVALKKLSSVWRLKEGEFKSAYLKYVEKIEKIIKPRGRC